MIFVCIVLFVLVAVLSVAVIKIWNTEKAHRSQLQRYSGIADLEAAVGAAKNELEKTKQQARETTEGDARRRDQLEGDYKRALSKYEDLQREVSLLEENLDVMSFGLYNPHFTFQTSDEYKDALIALRDKMKELVKSGGAATCPTEWTVNNDKREGAK
ncbi:MAG: hypothetical protein ACRD3Q_11880, partial [Terriglobales bacterium]